MDDIQREWVDTFSVEADGEIPQPEESSDPECTWTAL
jgi:hypothetical protein